ncbi:MAG: enoyl-CoA hydratase/isomerase family protein [Deltaproteobacteria bacterium]|nr:enoyl-CoA hydratase/isomerase family protein [Deltaproteobacteria bacterium]
MTEVDALHARVDGSIGWLTLDRPESRGALTRALWEQIPPKLEWLGNQDGVRAVVITGTAGNFIAGADISEFAQLRSDPGLARRYDQGAVDTIRVLERLAVPSIAMIGGPCLGGGCLIAFACDLRIASDEAFLESLRASWASRTRIRPSSDSLRSLVRASLSSSCSPDGSCMAPRRTRSASCSAWCPASICSSVRRSGWPRSRGTRLSHCATPDSRSDGMRRVCSRTQPSKS